MVATVSITWFGQPGNAAAGQNTKDGPAAYLFENAQPPANLRRPDTAAIRTRFVKVNTKALFAANKLDSTAPVVVRLNTFQDETLEATGTVMRDTAFADWRWQGHILDRPWSHVLLVAKGEAIVGEVNTGTARYVLRHIAAGLQLLEQVDDSQSLTLQVVSAPGGNGKGAKDPIVDPPPSSPTSSGEDDGSQVDVMVVYTQEARDVAGGTDAVIAVSELAVAQMNLALINSRIGAQVRLVHVAELDNKGVNDAWDLLNGMVVPDDGFVDEVHLWRDLYHADVVHGLYDSGGGLALLGGAFSVSGVNDTAAKYVFSHEVGHNLGCMHDRASSSQEGNYPYSYGLMDTENGFYTIMAYPCSGCVRLLSYATPWALYHENPTGIDQDDDALHSADCSRSISNDLHTYANLRVSGEYIPIVSAPGVPAHPVAWPIADNRIDLQWTNAAGEPFTLDLQRSTDGSTWTSIANLTYLTTAYVDRGLSPNTTYLYRLRASNDIGTSAFSAIAQATTRSAPNHTPVAIAQSVIVPPEQSAEILLQGYDYESDPLTFVVDTGPSFGSMAGSPPVLSYTPDAGYAGTDELTFAVDDGLGSSYPASVSIQVVSSTDNLVINPGFEEGTVGWNAIGETDIVSADAYAGQSSLSFTSTGSGSRWSFSDALPAAPMERYFVGAWLKTSGAATADLRLFWRDEVSNIQIVPIGSQTGDQDWTYYDAVIDAPPAITNAKIRIMATFPTDGGTIWADNVHVVPLGMPANQPPIAQAGSDLAVVDNDNSGNEWVTLDGSRSWDAEDAIDVYEWREDGTVVASGEVANLQLPVGSHEIELWVTDAAGATDSDVVFIDVIAAGVNAPPVADAGPDTTVIDDDGDGLQAVSLNGANSYDADGTIQTFVWTEASRMIAYGPTPNVELALGTHPIVLTITDDVGAVAQDDVLITVSEPITLTAPDSLTAVTDGQKVTLTWHDNSANEEGFYVQRGVKSGKNVIYSTLATVGPDVSTYLDVVLSSGLYYYRVQAFAAGGTVVSAYSNEVAVRLR